MSKVVRNAALPHGDKKLPSFYIIGTMKGGTTALYDHMCTHPRVVGGENKEVHYFSLYPDRGIDWYEQQFSNVPDDCLTLDASPTYFDMCFGRGIPAHIKSVTPDAKLFLIVRDPVARAISHFHHLKKINASPVLEDVTAEEFFSRDLGAAFGQRTNIDILLYQVLSFSNYLPKLWSYRSVFDPNDLMVLTNDELKSSPKETMRKVYKHVGLDWHEHENFGAFRHSTGSSIEDVSCKVFAKLGDLLYPSYERFCSATGLDFKPLRPSHLLKSTSQKEKSGLGDSERSSSLDDSVHVGRDGWLFLAGGSNRSASYFSASETPFTRKVRDGWTRLLLKRRRVSENLGARYIHLMAPEKLSVYPENALMHLDLHVRPGAQLGRIEDLKDVFLDPTSYFQRVKAHAKVYWKTDTHWTWWGCFAAYQLLMSRLGLKTGDDILSSPYNEGAIEFDLGSKMVPPVREIARFYNPIKNSIRVQANELVEFQEKNKRLAEIELHVGTSVIYRNDVNPVNDKTVVIFGDSFSEYRPNLLTGILAESFRETHFLWTANMDFDYVSQVKPDFVISESAERFMSKVPTDDVSFSEFVTQRLARLDVG